MGLQPTASRSALLLQCPRPFDPEVEPPENEAENAATRRRDAAARYGDAFHAIAERAMKKLAKRADRTSRGWLRAPEAIVDRICDKRGIPQTQRLDLVKHATAALQELVVWLEGKNPFERDFLAPGAELATEQSYALMPGSWAATSEPPDSETHVYPDLEKGEVGMTIDLEIWGPDWSLFLDYKSGRLGDWSSPSLVPQMRTIGLMAERRVYLGVLDANRQTGIPAVYGDEYEPEERQKHERTLKKALRLIGSGYIRPGPECKYCVVRSSCPAMSIDLVQTSTTLIEAATGGMEIVAKDKSLTVAERLGKFHQLKGVILRLFDRVDPDMRRGVEDILAKGGFVVRPDGKLLDFDERMVERLSKQTFIDAVGKAEAERWFKRLRRLGILEAKKEVHLRAVDNERVMR